MNNNIVTAKTENDNLSTIEKYYSLFQLANEAVIKARAVKHLAFIKADHNPTPDHIKEFLEAGKALETAEENLKSVRSSKKFFKK